jgi:hypothetical protein
MKKRIASRYASGGCSPAGAKLKKLQNSSASEALLKAERILLLKIV